MNERRQEEPPSFRSGRTTRPTIALWPVYGDNNTPFVPGPDEMEQGIRNAAEAEMMSVIEEMRRLREGESP